MRHRPQACRGGLRYRAGCTGGTFTPQTPWPGVSLTSGESREALCPRRGWGVSPAFGRKSETRSGRELTLVFPFRRRFKMGWALPFHANEFTFENSSWGQFDFYKGGRFGQKPPRGGDSSVSSHSQKDNEGIWYKYISHIGIWNHFFLTRACFPSFKLCLGQNYCEL